MCSTRWCMCFIHSFVFSAHIIYTIFRLTIFSRSICQSSGWTNERRRKKTSGSNDVFVIVALLAICVHIVCVVQLINASHSLTHSHSAAHIKYIFYFSVVKCNRPNDSKTYIRAEITVCARKENDYINWRVTVLLRHYLNGFAATCDFFSLNK